MSINKAINDIVKAAWAPSLNLGVVDAEVDFAKKQEAEIAINIKNIEGNDTW